VIYSFILFLCILWPDMVSLHHQLWQTGLRQRTHNKNLSD